MSIEPQPTLLDREEAWRYYAAVQEGDPGLVGVTSFYEQDSGWDRDEEIIKQATQAQDKETTLWQQ